jgi:hypothetical protein
MHKLGFQQTNFMTLRDCKTRSIKHAKFLSIGP